jgi:hypothetical protein
MQGPDTLTSAYADRAHEQETLLDVADRAIVRNEWVIAYEHPLGAIYEENEPDHRGYITVWWRDTDGYYHRKQMLSGDDDWIQVKFGSLAEGDTERIESFIGRESFPHP